MAKVHANQDVAEIKLFGKTISLRETRVINDDHKDKADDHEEEEISILDKKPDKIISCPRCKSMETKFCYFNNYNVNQPRHFCRGCQRYWTAGGTLRNVPVGAGRRKTKPPCLDGCMFDHAASEMQQFDFDGMVEEWHMAAAAAATHGGFRHVFPAKRRRRSLSGGAT